MAPPTTPEPLWRIDDVSAYLRFPVQTLYQWRTRKYGPPAARVGRHLSIDLGAGVPADRGLLALGNSDLRAE
ncbi:helix-turn-helix transcriptional regulator [Micromonospora sp. NPDC049903]|uniref:helix-turn-helix transcriptional regulator n=1 Tax=Micromonospora sp. NPDC049903 TaxID=3364276 RepID=UPI00379973F2